MHGLKGAKRNKSAETEAFQQRVQRLRYSCKRFRPVGLPKNDDIAEGDDRGIYAGYDRKEAKINKK